ALEHSYPGYDARSLALGLPEAVVKSPARLFAEALEHDDVLVQLVGLRWFYVRHGDAKRYMKSICNLLTSSDHWVRLEAAKTISQIHNVDEATATAVSRLL